MWQNVQLNWQNVPIKWQHFQLPKYSPCLQQDRYFCQHISASSPLPVIDAIIYLNSGGEMPAKRHMAAVELRLPVSRRFLCLGRITSCWVPLRGGTFKAAALSAAGATSGDRLHTLPEALHFFSLSLLSLFFGVWINFSSFSCRLSKAPPFHRFSGRVAAIWQRLTGGAQLLLPLPNTDFYLDFPTTTPQ